MFSQSDVSRMDVHSEIIQQNVPGSTNGHNEDDEFSFQLDSVKFLLGPRQDSGQTREYDLSVQVLWMRGNEDISGS